MIYKLIKLLEKGETIILIGPTAAGKDTIMQEILQKANSRAKPLVSHTSRPRRKGEINGVEYWFTSPHIFKENPKMFVEITSFLAAGETEPWYYGLSVNEALKSGIAIMNFEGYVNFLDWRENMEMKSPILVYVDVDYEVAAARYKLRDNANMNEFERRWEEDKEWLRLAEVNSDYYINNN